MSNKYSPSAFKTFAGNPHIHFLSEDLENKINKIIPTFDQINPSSSFFFVFDFPKMEYLFVSESVQSVTGYSAERWRKDGIDWVIRVLYQEDARRLIQLHSALFEFYYSVPIEERKDYRYAYELRLVREDGSPIWLLQQGSFIELCEDGKPAITFDILTDVTKFKKDKTMTLTMSKGNLAGCVLYFPIEGDITFSSREVEILKLIEQGLSSKQVGAELCISCHTVDTHRRNMLRRANKKDSTALVFYAKENGLI